MLSPLKENITNFKSTHVIKELIPTGAVVDSYLLFSGEIELNLAQSDRFVVAHTNKYVIYEFWKSTMEEPWRVAEMVKL